jgi:hypothetical protein
MTADDGSETDQSSGADEPGGGDAVEQERCHETVDPATRTKTLTRDKHRCRTCGSLGPGAGGNATLHVHHIEREPDDMDVHDLENLTTLCRSCHSWLHQQSSEEDVPVRLTEADARILLPHDQEILQVLAEIGPAMTSDVTDALSADLSVIAVRERLWTLMGLDNTVESRDQQIVDQDPSSGEWGLTGQIASSARGRIPDDSQVLIKRVADERVRQALDRGCGRETIADVFGIHPRTTWIKEKRARAYGFPLDAVAESGGRPSTDDGASGPTDGHTESDDTDDDQQRLTALAANLIDGAPNADAGADAAGSDAGQRGQSPGRDAAAIQERLQDVLTALESLEGALQNG